MSLRDIFYFISETGHLSAMLQVGVSILRPSRRVKMKTQKYFSIANISPLRVAYALDMVIIALVPTDFSDECFRFGNAIWVGALALCVIVVFLCILAPRNAHHRFLPAVLALFGLLALMICEPL